VKLKSVKVSKYFCAFPGRFPQDSDTEVSEYDGSGDEGRQPSYGKHESSDEHAADPTNPP
jgi:hypothetical protein